ncbi:MAG: HAD family hydrolase [Nanoarchaeota archaeon]|nr:HAD family hydrolase [Nanoarchaeota archaeon]
MKRKVLFLDMDGTLYPIEQASFLCSPVHDQIRERTIKYICEKSGKNLEEAKKIFEKLMKDYPKCYSFGLEEWFGFNRKEYLDYSWNMEASKLIKPQPELRYLLKDFSEKYDIYLVSDAPGIWIKNVINFLGIGTFLKGQFSGTDLNKNKKEGLFRELLIKTSSPPREAYMVGDEDDIDIMPANKEGIITIHITKDKGSSGHYKANNLKEARDILMSS